MASELKSLRYCSQAGGHMSRKIKEELRQVLPEKALAAMLGRRLIRLQCYEGLDAASAIYEWNFAAQMIAIRTAEVRVELGELIRVVEDLMGHEPCRGPFAAGRTDAIAASGAGDAPQRPAWATLCRISNWS